MQTQRSDIVSIEAKIKAEAFRLGFSLCGITTPESPAGFERYEKWLSAGRHAGMTYLESPYHRSMRQQPDQLLPGVKTIISLGWPYHLNQTTTDEESSNNALIAGYAFGTDYHLWLPAKLDELVCFIQKEINPNIKSQTFTDSAPILEREIASCAGLGWIGKNACLINPDFGSAFLLAELFIDTPLLPDQPFAFDRCGTCHRCVDACPTSCIQPDRTIDSTRCISYLTIENKGMVPEEIRSSFGKWLFGCDVCQMVCPWNKTSQKPLIQPTNLVWTIDEVSNLFSISTAEFSDRFTSSALFRSRLKGMQRNALIWLGNNGKHDQVGQIETFLQQTTDVDLFEAARWAISKIRKE